MKRFAGFVALAVVLAMQCAAEERVKHAMPVAGTVLNELGRPMAGATVEVYLQDCDEPIATIRTDKSGKFLYTPMRGLPAMTCRFVATAPGYTRGVAGQWSPKTTVPDIQLFKERIVRGTVVDEAGKLLEGVTVKVAHADGYNRTEGAPRFRADETFGGDKQVTGKDGTFALHGIADPSGFEFFSVGLAFSKLGRSDVRQFLQKNDALEPIKVVMPPAAVITGKLMLPGGPIPPDHRYEVGVSVKGPSGYSHKNAIPDKDGTFRFENMPPGDATVRVHDYAKPQETGDKAPYVLPLQEFTLTAGETRGLELVMQRAAVVKGTVTDDATGKPIAGASVRVRDSRHGEGDSGSTVTTDATGGFTVHAAPGEVQIRVTEIKNPDGSRIWFTDSEAPTAEFTVAEGEEKSDVAVKVDLTVGRESRQTVEVKPIPPDLELVSGTYTLTWDPELESGLSHAWPFGRVEKKTRDLIHKLPDRLSDSARFTLYQIDGKEDKGHMAYIVDGDKLYMDVNRNWDLSDDAPISFTLPQQGGERRLAWVSVKTHQGALDGKHTEHPIGLRPVISQRTSGLEVYFERRGAWKGVLDTNKGKCAFALIDGGLNGIYSDRLLYDSDLHTKGPGDELRIDLAGTGNIRSDGGARLYFVSEATRILSKYYVLTASEVGDSLKVAPYTGPMGELDILVSRVHGIRGGTAGRARVITSKGTYWMYDEKPPFTIPAGPCRIEDGEAVLNAPGTSGLRIRYVTRKPVEVEAGKTTTIDISGKLSIAVDPTSSELVWKPGQPAIFPYTIRIGENIGVVRVGDDISRQVFVVKVVDSDGKAVADARGGDTGGPTPRCVVAVPEIKPGDYTLRFSLRTGTELDNLSASRGVRIAHPSDLSGSDLYARLHGAYEAALNSGDPILTTGARRRFLRLCFRETAIQPGEKMRLDKPSQAVAGNFPGADRLSAVITWQPRDLGLEVEADVTDTSFSTSSQEGKEWNSSCLEVFVSANGLNDRIFHLFIVPEGPESAPRMRTTLAKLDTVELEGVTASWKRTTGGYWVKALIPWGVLPGFEKDWEILPVEAAVDTMTRRGQVQLRMCASSKPFATTYGYAGLRAK